MNILSAVCIAFSTYSALPTPRVAWRDDTLRRALAAFPLVGAAVALAWWGAAALCAALALPDTLCAAAWCVLPALVTGGIHLDGYADTSDALASQAPPERKQEILRDPHIGAFAVIRLCVYFIAYFALCRAAAPTARTLWCMGCGFALSRALSGLLLTVLPVAAGSRMAKALADAADRRFVRAVLGVSAALLVAAMCWCGGFAGAAMLGAAALVTARYCRTARAFGGTSGDLAGWFLVKAEFWMLAALVAAQYGGSVR